MTHEKLKQGFTTGAAVAASVKAALIMLLTGEAPRDVKIRFLTEGSRIIPIYKVNVLSKSCCEVSVIKDAGDDPDVTHKAEIGARVTLYPGPSEIIITGGKGVGRVTRPGLEVPVGEAAINPGPRKMIYQTVQNTFELLDIPFNHHIQVEAFVPKGEDLAEKTLNARLGIVGGISILGTTGIVKPLSHDAYIATIRYGVSVARAGGSDTLVFTTGRRSERFAMDFFPDYPAQAFIQTGDFFKAGIDSVMSENSRPDRSEMPVRRIIYTVFFGKAVKMAMGFEHTHAAKSELTMKKLAEWTREITGDIHLYEQVRSANTARHAFSHIYPAFPGLIDFVGQKLRESALGFAKNKIDMRAIILDFEGCPVFDSNSDPG